LHIVHACIACPTKHFPFSVPTYHGKPGVRHPFRHPIAETRDFANCDQSYASTLLRPPIMIICGWRTRSFHA